jgi:Txe/YoeB family toxin of toxin-antitoxin system
VSWRLVYAKQARLDAKKLSHSGLREQAQTLLDLLARDPFETPPRFEKLRGDLRGFCSRRINVQHRLVYQVLEKERVIKVVRMWSHYE